MSITAILEIVKTYGDWLIYGIAIFAAVKKIIVPIKDIQETNSLILWSHLASEHDHFMHMGYCPPGDKKRLCDVHKAYKNRNLNHLADGWEKDILDLPDKPKQ